MELELETVNKLFLELSQFTTATTAREKSLRDALKAIVEEPHHEDGTTEMKLRLIAKDALR